MSSRFAVIYAECIAVPKHRSRRPANDFTVREISAESRLDKFASVWICVAFMLHFFVSIELIWEICAPFFKIRLKFAYFIEH